MGWKKKDASHAPQLNYCIVLFNNSYRHPNKNHCPSFSDLHTSLSDHTLSLGMKESQVEAEGPDQSHLHPLTIGAPLEAGKELFTDLYHCVHSDILPFLSGTIIIVTLV